MWKVVGRAAVVSLTAATTFLAGCTSDSPPALPMGSQGPFDRAMMAEAEAKLGNATMAFFVGPQNSEMHSDAGEIYKPGYLVLVGADGSFRVVRTERMDMMRPAWSSNGLYFADESSDYHLTASGLTKTANPKSAAQNLMFALSGGGSVGVFNNGYGSDGGYINQVAVTVDGTARSYKVQGNYFTGALCGNKVFGLTNRPGTNIAKRPKSPDLTSPTNRDVSPQMLAQLYPPVDGGEKVVAWRPQFGGGTPAGPVSCHKGVISFLSWDSDADRREKPTAVAWDTITGKYRAIPLDFGGTTQIDSEDFSGIVQDGRDGQIDWVDAGGRVFTSDSTSGKTTTRFSSTSENPSSRHVQTLFAFSETQLHTLTTIPGAKGNLTYTVFARSDGKVVRKNDIQIPNTEISISFRNLSYMVAS
jgi:hypothetical protein